VGNGGVDHDAIQAMTFQGARKSRSAPQPCVRTLEMRSVTRSWDWGKDGSPTLAPGCDSATESELLRFAHDALLAVSSHKNALNRG